MFAEQHSTAVPGRRIAAATNYKEHEVSELEKNDEVISEDDEYEEELQDRVDAIRHGAETPYNPLKEELPKVAAYHPSFIEVEQCCKKLVSDTATLLTSAECKDPRIAQLLHKALESHEIIYPPPRKIGLMGDSGVGKSYVLFSFPCLNTYQSQDVRCVFYVLVPASYPSTD